MPGAPVGSIMEFTVRGTLAGQAIMSVLHYRIQTASTLPTVQAEQDAFLLSIWAAGAGNMKAEYLDCVPSNYIGNWVRAQVIRPARQRASQDTFTDTGLRDPALTANLAAVLTKRTALAGRKQVGSLHLPTGAAGDVNEGVITPAYIPSLTALAQELTENHLVVDGGGVYVPVIYHRDPFALEWDDITDVIVQPEARVMRRRTVGLGI